MSRIDPIHVKMMQRAVGYSAEHAAKLCRAHKCAERCETRLDVLEIETAHVRAKLAKAQRHIEKYTLRGSATGIYDLPVEILVVILADAGWSTRGACRLFRDLMPIREITLTRRNSKRIIKHYRRVPRSDVFCRVRVDQEHNIQMTRALRAIARRQPLHLVIDPTIEASDGFTEMATVRRLELLADPHNAQFPWLINVQSVEELILHDCVEFTSHSPVVMFPNLRRVTFAGDMPESIIRKTEWYFFSALGTVRIDLRTFMMAVNNEIYFRCKILIDDIRPDAGFALFPEEYIAEYHKFRPKMQVYVESGTRTEDFAAALHLDMARLRRRKNKITIAENKS